MFTSLRLSPMRARQEPCSHSARAFCAGLTLTAAILGVAVHAPALCASTVFAEFVAERNLIAPEGSFETFDTIDGISRWNGALRQSLPLGMRYPVAGFLSYQLHLEYSSSIWQYESVIEGSAVAIAAEPASRFNAGLGWNISFGRLLAPASADNPSHFWVYEAPTGERTRFYAEFEDGAGSDPNVYYSRDSSYRRLHVQGDVATLDRPKGLSRIFEQHGGIWRFHQEKDLFGNTLSADYSVTDEVRLVDSHGRQQRLLFESDPAGGERLHQVVLSAFAGTDATYTLAYDVVAVDRPSQDTATSTPAQVTVSRLRSLTLPTGEVYDFAYAEGSFAQGRLESVALPTGGRLAYAWQEIALPLLDGALHAADPVAVASRQALGFPSSEGGPESLVGEWTFTFSLDQARIPGAIDQPRELSTVVQHPDGHGRHYKHSVYVTGDAGNGLHPSSDFEPEDYALPITKKGKAAGNPFHTSEVVYDQAGAKVRTRYLHYERSACAGCFDTNPRVSKMRTKFHDGNYRETEEYSDFDGLGQYRKHVSYDSSATAPLRRTEIDYIGTRPAVGKPWLLGLHTRRTVSEDATGGGTETSMRESCLDPATGLLLRRRVLAGDQRQSHDLLEVHEYSAAGQRTLTRYFGGDVQGLDSAPTTDLCDLALPSAEAYAAYTAYQFGAPSERGWLAADGALFLRTYSATIDSSTGLVASDAGANDFTWAYTYDSLGRRTASTPPLGHGGSSETFYNLASALAPASVESLERDADGTLRSHVISELDALGRPGRTRVLTVDGWADGIHEVDAMGRTTRLVSPEGGETRLLDHDALGRPGRILPPEGPIHERLITYQGRGSSETIKIGKSWDEASQNVIRLDRTTTSVRDRHGRLIEKTLTDADGEWRRETYSRNLRGHIVETTITDGVETSVFDSPDRRDGRGFTVLEPTGETIVGYDARGKLTVRDHGQGPIFSVFDRAGRLLEKREGSANGTLWVRNVYGTANVGGDYRRGQLIQSQRMNRGLPHVPNGYVRVTENYQYQADGGRRSTVGTRVVAGHQDSMPLFEFEAEHTLDPSGHILSSEFPDCKTIANNAFSQCAELPERTLHFDYALGRLQRVDETRGQLGGGSTTQTWIDQVTYHVSGVPTSRVLANGWVESQVPHLSGRGRIERMTLSHPSFPAYYDSGLAEYDGPGKLVKLGDQRHVSEHAYALEVPSMPPDAGTPIPLPDAGPMDALGQRISREYRVPDRYAPYGIAWEQVREIYVYGPGNRVLWTRYFNQHDVVYSGYSKDEWRLIDAQGRTVRTRPGLSFYDPGATFADAHLESVELHSPGGEAVDQIFVEGRRLGTVDNRFGAPQEHFFHHDLQGRLFAISDGDGNIQANGIPVQ